MAAGGSLAGPPTSPDHFPTGASGRSAKQAAAAASKAEEVEWLRDIVQKRPGWDAFFSGSNHTLQNPDIAQSWQFAVAFAKEYSKTASKCPVGCSLFYSMPLG